MATKKGIYIFALIGLFLGTYIDYLVRVRSTVLFFPAVIVLACYLFVLAYDDKNLIRLLCSSVITAFVLSLPIFPLDISHLPESAVHLIGFMLLSPLFIYVGHCFHYAYHRDNGFHLKYSTLFEAVWNTLLLITVGLIFSGLAISLVSLAAIVFQSVGNDYLWNLYFHNTHFRLISNYVLFFIGLGIGQEHSNLVFNLRFLLLKMMYFLFPVLAFISILYCVLYSVSFLTGGQVPIEPLMILIPLSVLGILFFNAYFQDGELQASAPQGLTVFLKVYRVVLFFLALMMAYKLFAEFPIETNVFICILTVVFFAATYGLTVILSPEDEKLAIQGGNIGTALFFLVALFLCNLPYLPIEFTVGHKTGVDYDYLRHFK